MPQNDNLYFQTLSSMGYLCHNKHYEKWDTWFNSYYIYRYQGSFVINISKQMNLWGQSRNPITNQ